MRSSVLAVYELAIVKGNLDGIPSDSLSTKKGADGNLYYEFWVQIQVTYYSAYTTYELFHNDINYGSVTAEYV